MIVPPQTELLHRHFKANYYRNLQLYLQKPIEPLATEETFAALGFIRSYIQTQPHASTTLPEHAHTDVARRRLKVS